MKILFISDIHGISKNLYKIKELEEQNDFDKIVCLGDLYYAGPSYNAEEIVDSKKVLEFLMNYNDKLICLKGNCDSDVDIKASDFPTCSNLALICVDGLDIYLTHGNEYNKEKNRKFNRKGILIYGHEHIPYIETIDDMVYVNVGSISLPRNNFNPTYAIYNNKKITILDLDDNVINEIEL